MSGLTDEQREILDFEKSWWKFAGAKESAVRERFGLTFPAYFQRLNHIIDLPAALEHDPMTVRRLLRLRDARRGQRSARRLEA